ncbi:MAG: hypothetical protein GDA43_16950 [Hormoscilla sp. SP5CHS1]|nr:hypothetical protein [Hormoscilla sp. SP12CHS1]MBC6454678.1 hypothetical protein [Hormoscilla sp. SP5CHS1]MBC6475893.1 hypothetical protein [Hormoscilla sp. GM102CHS1]
MQQQLLKEQQALIKKQQKELEALLQDSLDKLKNRNSSVPGQTHRILYN